MKVTYFGHACFGVELSGKNLLFDPFISQNPMAEHINIGEIEADYILLSHGHGDHVSDAAAIAASTGATLIAGFEVTNWFASKGLQKCLGMNIGGQKTFEFGTLKCVNAIHSSQLPDGKYGGNPMGFLVINNERSFYYSGDTGLTVDMQLIPMFAKLDLAIFPIGDYYTMGINDAIQAAKMVQVSKVMGVHYDTFEDIKINRIEAIDAFAKNGLQLLLPSIGETIDL